MKKLFCILVLSLSFSFLASAADPVVTKEDGKPVTIKWDDTKIAEYQIAKGPLFTGEVPFQVSENSCSNTVPQGCFLKMHVQIHLPVIYWKKHPKPEREGKVVLAKFSNQEFLINFPYIITMDERILKDPIAKDFPVDEIVCDDFSWLPGKHGTTPPNKTTVTKWNVEKMVTNPETGVSENRPVGGGDQVELEKVGPKSLGIMRAKALFGPQKTLIRDGDILALVLPTADGEFCQISIKANSQKFANEAGAKYYEVLAAFKPSAAPYLWKSDEFSTTRFPYFFQYFLQKPASWDPQ